MANFVQLDNNLLASVLKQQCFSDAHSRAFVTVSLHKHGYSAFTSAATMSNTSFAFAVSRFFVTRSLQASLQGTDDCFDKILLGSFYKISFSEPLGQTTAWPH